MPSSRSPCPLRYLRYAVLCTAPRRLLHPCLLLAAMGLLVMGPGGRFHQVQAQFLAIPVMDLARRQAAASYGHHRDAELAQQTIDWAYDLISGLGLEELHFRDAASTLDAVSSLLHGAAALGYSADDLATTFATVFDTQADADVARTQMQRIAVLLESYAALAATGPALADDLESAAAFIDGVRSQVEAIGENVFGYDGLGSHQQAAQAAVPMAIYGAEELLHLRQSVALQTNADVIQYADEVAYDHLCRQILRRALYGPLPLE